MRLIRSKKKRKRHDDDTSSSSPSLSSVSPSSSSSSDEASSKYRKRSRRRRDDSSRREREERSRRERMKKKERKERERDKNRRRSKGKRKVSDFESELGDESGDLKSGILTEDVIREILEQFPGVFGDIEQLLRMIDGGQAVDINGLSERSLIKHLKRLFLSLNLKENGNNVFLLPPNAAPTLDIVLPMIQSEDQSHRSASPKCGSAVAPGSNGEEKLDDSVPIACLQEDVPGPKRRVIGPAMPSAELLAAAAKLTEAEAELREVEVEEDMDLFIGPAPPAMVTEAASVNEAERFEEVTRIMGAEVDSPYDVVGVNRNMSADNIKKRYWKLSLMVHPDKCTHPEAHQAFIKLNKAFKDLQDSDKRKALDDKIKLKEEQEEFKAELKAMREAAQWRRLQGISMEGDDFLLAEMDMKVEPKRDEWMTTLPPERKPGGMPTHTTNFSRNSKEGRGDTRVWTDTPSDRAQKAKMNYLEAYNEASALMSKEEEKKQKNSDAQLVDEYNKAKRSKSLVEKHQEMARSGNSSKKKAKKEATTKQEWEGEHPWKPWDREKDLTAGRKSVNFDSKDMSQGLSSRFSSGSFQRSFL